MSGSNSLNPDQAQHFVRPDLGPNSLQRLSADNTSRQRVKVVAIYMVSKPCHTIGQARAMVLRSL